jgi:NAD(P)-dependent dehydrogenase (short-subunit alcohol dehydrogenase family)
VNAVLVGAIRAGGHARRAAELGVDLEAHYQQLARERGVPLGRVGRAEEFADLVTYLVSSRSSYVNGTAVNIDGGASAVA